MVGSVNDYQKESQFRALNAKKDDMMVYVLRDGQKKTMSCHELVVGDIVLLSGGDIVSCDGYVVGRNDLAISEKMLTGEPVLKKKGEYKFDGDKVGQTPTIFGGTFVQEGEGRMLVMAVGTATYQGTMKTKMDEADAEHARSVLQVPARSRPRPALASRRLTGRGGADEAGRHDERDHEGGRGLRHLHRHRPLHPHGL
eukprot:2736706-Rhodomonas_salina.1